MTDSDLQHGHHWDRVKDLTGWELTENAEGRRRGPDGAQAGPRLECRPDGGPAQDQVSR